MLSLISILLTMFLGNNKAFDTQLKNYLDSRLQSYVKYEYHVVRMPSSFARIEINKEKEFRVNKNYALVPVNIYSVKNSISAASITIKLKLYKNVFVAAQKIERSQKLDAGMFVLKLEDVSCIEGTAFENAKELSSYRSRTAIREGSIIVNGMLEPIPIVNVGDKMVLHAGKNGVDVATDVIARQEGCFNELINVQAESRVFKAKIIDRYNLRLEE